MDSMSDFTEGSEAYLSRETVLSSSSVDLRCEELLRLTEHCGKGGISLYLFSEVSLSNNLLRFSLTTKWINSCVANPDLWIL